MRNDAKYILFSREVNVKPCDYEWSAPDPIRVRFNVAPQEAEPASFHGATFSFELTVFQGEIVI